MENLKASVWRNLSTGTPPKFFSTILCFAALVYNWCFFQNSPFTEIMRHTDSHTNPVISHTFAYSSRWRRKPRQGLLTKDSTRRGGSAVLLRIIFVIAVIIITIIITFLQKNWSREEVFNPLNPYIHTQVLQTDLHTLLRQFVQRSKHFSLKWSLYLFS